ncbi:MAG: Crp/Fnr family transcriptional regulator [Terrimonas sp.]|nr:Crp/Fnr family transcriptional regulator [Terrimonas sp.]OJY97950.1 MAG: hypothetical protein BGP13_09805 [Sphingobacteriales bacterium 40-81]
MLAFIKKIQTIVALPPDLIEFLFSRLKVTRIARRQLLLREGQVCDYIYFVKSGLLRSYANGGETEVTNWFMKESDIFTAPLSFYHRVPSFENLQAIEESELVCLHYQDIQTIYKDFPFFNLAGRLVTEQYIAALSRYNYISRIKPSELRYQYFTADFPELLGRVPDKDVASFLGMTDAHFSRVKSRRS